MSFPSPPFSTPLETTLFYVQYVCPTKILNKSPATVKKFCTNCDESVLKTVKTPASFMSVASPMERPGKSKVAATPASTLGMETRNKV